MKGILRLSFEVDLLHNQYEELLKLENDKGLNHHMSNAALKMMRKEQDKLNKLVGNYINEKGEGLSEVIQSMAWS